MQLRESLATLMKHSTRYQQQDYNDTTQQQKTKKARDVLCNKLASDIFGEADIVYISDMYCIDSVRRRACTTIGWQRV
jgi:hypothetical protein